MNTVAASHRTDEQKACRKLVIQQGLRLGQRGGLLLILAAAGIAVGLSGAGTVRVAGCLAAVAFTLTSVPFIIMGKRLARQDSRVLAAIDDPSLVAAIHLEATPKMKDRYAIAIRHADDTADHMILGPRDLETLRAYFFDSRPDLMITQSDNAARTIRMAVS